MKSLWSKYKETPFVIKITTGFIAGLLAGIFLSDYTGFLVPFGTLLLNLLSLVAIPIIFLTVILAVNQMSLKQLGNTGGKLILYYTITTAAAVVIGLSLALWLKPGKNIVLPDVVVDKPEIPHFSDILLQIVPKNLFEAFSTGDLMAILFVAVIMGMALSTMKFSTDTKIAEYGDLMDRFFTALNTMFYKILDGVLLYAPIGVFAISATAFGQQGLETVKGLLTFLAAFYLGAIILWIFVYSAFIKFSGFPVLKFYKDTKEAYTTALFTSSSIASLPVAIRSAQKAGVTERTANFSLPLGAVFNSDGGALRMGISLVFAANITNLNLSITDFVIIIVIGTLLSIGTAGVPAAGLVTLSVVLALFGLPMEIVALIAGIDALIGMGGTALNVMGDIVGAAVVDRKENKAQKVQKA